MAMDRGLLAVPSAPLAAEGGSSPSAVLTDADIMLRVKAGDESAFSYLVQKYRRAMVHFMYRMAHSPAVAEDLAQEVFLRVYRSRENYEPTAKFTTWLYRIATNLAVNHIRDTRHERQGNMASLDEPDPETGRSLDVADVKPTTEEVIIQQGAAGGHPRQGGSSARAPKTGGAHAQISADGLQADCRSVEVK